MAVTDAFLVRQLAQGIDLPFLAERHGVSQRYLKNLEVRHLRRRVRSHDGLGPNNLREFIVAVKDVDDAWPENDQAIEEARRKFDDGEGIMISTRDGNNIILYLIPIKNPLPNHRPYFSQEKVDEYNSRGYR